MDSSFKLAAFASVLTLVFCQGLQASPRDFKFIVDQRGLLLRSLAAVLVIVPFTVFLVILLMQPIRPVAIGMALFAAAPAAPLILFRISRFAPRREYAASLHVAVALLSIVTVPLTVSLLSRGLGFTGEVGHQDVAVLVAKLIVVPIVLGLTLRAAFEGLATKAVRPLEALGKVLLLVALAILLSKTYRFFGDLSLHSYLSMTAAIAISLLIGHLMAGRVSDAERSLLALESAGRNPALVLLIVSLNAPHANAMPILVPYLCVFLVVSALYIKRESLLPRKLVAH